MIQFETLLSIDELSKELGITTYNIYSKIRKGDFPEGVKINGRRKFKPIQIVEYYRNLGVTVTFSE